MRNSTRRALVAAAMLALVAVFLPATGASAQEAQSCAIDIEDYEGSAVLSVDPLQVFPGETVTISGTGWPPGAIVPLAFNGDEFAAPVADESGGFSITFAVPADIAPGIVEFTALCGAFTLTTQLTVLDPSGTTTTVLTTPTTQGSGSLTPTGGNSTQLFQVAAALLAVGALLVFLARRQAQRRNATISV